MPFQSLVLPSHDCPLTSLLDKPPIGTKMASLDQSDFRKGTDVSDGVAHFDDARGYLLDLILPRYARRMTRWQVARGFLGKLSLVLVARFEYCID